jgi:hypothetical protein
MTTAASSLFRSLVIYTVCVPLALLLGYLLSTPYDPTTFIIVGAVLFLLLIPLLLRWHHIWLVASWNMTVVLFFLPGRPLVWLALAWISGLIAFLQYILNRKHKVIYVRELTRPLILLAVVTIVTAEARGGFGMRAFGGETFGAKRYLFILSAIVGYFAITSQRIPKHRVPLYVALYFLGTVTMAIGEFAVIAPTALYFLFLMFPVSGAGMQAIMNDPGGPKPGILGRLGGLGVAGDALCLVMLCRYGIKELFSWRHLGRVLVFFAFLFMVLLAGYRSMLILLLLTFALLFYLEGLVRSPLLPGFMLIAVLGGALLVPFADRLPPTVQRTLSFLPLPVDPVIKATAQSSTEWRLQMWKHLLPEVPHYLLLGKGYTFSVRDLAMVQLADARQASSEGFELTGDLHNGPLSVIVPFGIAGMAAFLWLMIAIFKVVRANYLYGDPAFNRVNGFILAFFLAKLVAFFVVYGGFYGDLPTFTGLVALSISINGGVAKKVPAVQPALVINRFKLQPPTLRPANA